MGIANFALGCIGVLPVMPLLIRSSANIEFGAKTRMSQILLGVWLIFAFAASAALGHIPMASVASLLFVVGLGLIFQFNFMELARKGLSNLIPFLLTVVVILSVDLLWGIFTGFLMGIFFSLRSMVSRTMLVVDDGQNYLLKFYKDVSFIHKSELKDQLDSIPEDKSVMIDGTGNISIDPEIEEWLLEFQSDEMQKGRQVKFAKSQLALSKLFRGNKNG